MDILIDQDPIYLGPTDYRDRRARNAQRRAQQFGCVLDDGRVRDLALRGALVDAMAKLGTDSLERDPYYSTSIRRWIGGLERGLRGLETGAGRAYLEYFSSLPGFLADFGAEYPEDWPDRPPFPTAVIHDSIRIVSVGAIAKSLRLSEQVNCTFPDFLTSDRYEDARGGRFDDVVRHLDAALALLAERASIGYSGLKSAIHTIFVCRLGGGTASTGTRFDYPGILFAGLSDDLLATDDVSFTASVLYHEHCHGKMVLFAEELDPALPRDAVYVSPFKNENRDQETMLHQLYPISMECCLRLATLDTCDPSGRERAVGHLVATANRLETLLEITSRFDLAKAGVIRALVELATTLVTQIHEEGGRFSDAVKEEFARDKRHVLKRHVWDIGQMLCRGVNVVDPWLSAVRTTPDVAEFCWRGEPRVIRRGERRRTESRYDVFAPLFK